MAKTLYLKSLGCARNQVDSEQMLGWLQGAEWQVVHTPEKASVIIVNTCCFIEDAADESIDAILALCVYKEKGSCRRLVVTGCLPERYREEIIDALPEVDIFLGTGAFNRIIDAVEGRLDASGCLLPDPDRISMASNTRIRPEYPTAYLKIAEGCDRRCTYCIIPQLRGRQKSRPVEDIINEASYLISEGVKEITLVSQDTTFYGKDLSDQQGLGSLLDRLACLPEAKDAWIRFLYGHPESIESDVIEVVAKHPNLCPYFDIPIQHANSKILKLMGRRYSHRNIKDLFSDIRTRIPQAALRTTVIVGFPGETDSDFRELCDVVEEIGFDHLGVFTYSDSYDLMSHGLSDHVNKKLAQKRRKILMQRQQKLSARNNQKYLGREIKVLVESFQEKNLFLGRGIFQAPEVDGLIYLHDRQNISRCKVGNFYQARIIDALEYDLIGEVV